MNISIAKEARLYTWKEVREMLDDQRKAMIEEVSRKQDVIADARLYDEKLTDMYMHCETLRRMGFQKGALMNFILRLADLSEEVNDGNVDYRDIEKAVDDCLGCHLRDEGLYAELKERAMR